MKKYDIRDQYELHNLLKKIIPEGSYHDIRFKRMPQIIFGKADRDADIFELMVENAPISAKDLEDLVRFEYGYDYAVFTMAVKKFTEYYHDGIYTADQKQMNVQRREKFQAALPDDFYYLDEIRKKYLELFPDGDVQDVNPYNLKMMGFQVLSKYALQHFDSLREYFVHLLTKEENIDITPYRRRFVYVQMFFQCLIDLKRNLQIVEFEPNRIISFRKLQKAGVTAEMINDFCDAVNDSVNDGQYFTIRSVNESGFESEMYGLGFSEWFYANLLISDDKFSYAKMFGNIVFYKGTEEVTIKSFATDYIRRKRSIDIIDMMNDLNEIYGCTIKDKRYLTARIDGTGIFYDTILDRLYANKDLYYDELERES